MTKMFEVPVDEWEEILDRLSWLDALETAGVDGWEGEDEARRIYQEMRPDDED